MSPISIRINNKEAQRSVAEAERSLIVAPEAARETFWQPYLNERKTFSAYASEAKLPDEAEIQQRERRLEDDIAKYLRKSLMEYAKEASHDLPADAKTAPLAARHRAGRILFAVRVAGYSSLNLELVVGGLNSLNKIFGGDFTLFHVFLDHYLPAAFAAATSASFAGMMDYEISVPDDYQSGFSPPPADPGAPTVTDPGAPSTADPSQTSAAGAVALAQKNAQWVWILSNTSLLIPAALALAVLYYANGEVRAMRAEQATALAAERTQQTALLQSVADSQLQFLKRVTDQQADSLKDDRARLAALQDFEQQCLVEQIRGRNGAAPSAPSPSRRAKPDRTP